MHVRYVARSDAGLDREHNEDAGIAGPHVLAVADGMGGHAAGEVASYAVVSELARTAMPDGDPLDTLAALFTAANDRIRQLASESPDREGMGTTATALLTTGGHLPAGQVALGHIGDSRAYLLRDGTLSQITRDHTFVQTLIDDGQITASQARVHPARSVVTKALQGQDIVQPDLSFLDVQTGDQLLICSDGLTDVVPDETIEQTLAGADSIDAAADQLIRLGLEEGAPDNITVVLAEIVDLDGPPSPDGDGPTYLVGTAESS